MRLFLPHRQRTRLLGVTAAAVTVAALGLTPAAQAGAGQITTTGQTTATGHTAVAARQAGQARQPGPAARGLQPVRLPGLTAAAATVTLPTGAKVRLTRAGAGRYTVTADQGDPSGGAIATMTRGGPHGTTSLQAIPAAADVLVFSGALDRSLFDVPWLAGHGDSGSAARLGITIQYAGPQTAASLARAAGALPGAAVVAAHPAARTVDMKVAASKAAAFWAALTGQKTATASVFLPGQRPATLTGGAIHAWATGHHIAAVTATPADVPTYQVTETIKRSAGGEGCQEGLSLCVNPILLTLTAVTGDGEGNVYPADSLTCIDANPCTTIQALYDVPAGVYSADGFGFFYIEQQEQDVDLLSPQITVAGNTGFTINADTVQPITVSTPRPSQVFEGGVLGDYRGTPDGDWYTQVFLLGLNAYLPHFWATPTRPVTIGTFHMYSELLLGKAPLEMTATTPQHLGLDAMYSTQFEYPTAGSLGVVRFPDQESLQLVDAGFGTAQDFAGVDARGKLALIRIAGVYLCAPGGSAFVLSDQLDNAIDAGAAGVLIDSQDPNQDPNGWCQLPIHSIVEGGGGTPPDIPFASLPVSQADTLIGLLARHSVKVNITSYSGNSPYVYTLSLYREGFVPDSPQHTTLTGSELSVVTDRYHSIQPGSAEECWSPWRPQDFSVGGMCDDFVATPADFQLFRGPLSPDTVQRQDNTGESLDGSLLPAQSQYAYDVVNQPSGSDDWFADPAAPGASPVSADVLQAQPGKWSNESSFIASCSFCRKGDTFSPFMALASGADARLDGNLYGFDLNSIHLYSGGQEIPPTNFFGTGLAVYQLPPGAARYHLDTTFDNPTGSGTTTTSWDFTSSRPSTDQTPPGESCISTSSGSTDPCAPAAMPLLRYDAHTDLSNTLAAPGPHRLDVTAYHQAPDAPPVTSLKLWISTDSGTTWQLLKVRDLGNGRFTARYSLPALSQTSGMLSIKAAARDAAGSDISQTLLDSVKLAA